MNWDSALLTTKVFMYLGVSLLLSLANAATAVLTAVLFAAVCSSAGYPTMGYLVAVAGAVTMYTAGLAGRSKLLVEILPELMFSNVELTEVDRISREQDEKDKE